jgi:hypothetical protein
LHDGSKIYRVGLKGAGGLVREPNETVESYALQNLDPSRTPQALD